jgi:hypothetical protein
MFKFIFYHQVLDVILSELCQKDKNQQHMTERHDRMTINERKDKWIMNILSEHKVCSLYITVLAFSLGTNYPQTSAFKLQFHSISILWHGTTLSVTT